MVRQKMRKREYVTPETSVVDIVVSNLLYNSEDRKEDEEFTIKLFKLDTEEL